MKKFLLPAKREAADGGGVEPSASAADGAKRKRACKPDPAAADIAPVVIKIESDSSSDSAFESSPNRAVERGAKPAANHKKSRVKRDEPARKPPSTDAPSAGSYPAFPADIEDAQRSLLTWCAAAAPALLPPALTAPRRYSASKRDLPWRRQTGQHAAYGVWVSEIMLQQTRVATVVEYWNRWMAKWPSLLQLAASNIDDVNAMWSGLGYYRRARMLLEAGAPAFAPDTPAECDPLFIHCRVRSTLWPITAARCPAPVSHAPSPARCC